MTMLRKMISWDASGNTLATDAGVEGPLTLERTGSGEYTIDLPTRSNGADTIIPIISARSTIETGGTAYPYWANVESITASQVLVYTAYYSNSIVNYSGTAEILYEPQTFPQGGFNLSNPNIEGDTVGWTVQDSNGPVLYQSGTGLNPLFQENGAYVSYPTTMAPSIACVASAKGASAGSGTVAGRQLRVGTSPGANDLGQFDFPNTINNVVGTVNFTSPANGQVWISMYTTTYSLAQTIFTDFSCLPS